MDNFDTGLVVLGLAVVVLGLYLLATSAMKTNWTGALRQLARGLGEIIVSIVLAGLMLVILFGLTWCVGWVVNTIYGWF